MGYKRPPLDETTKKIHMDLNQENAGFEILINDFFTKLLTSLSLDYCNLLRSGIILMEVVFFVISSPYNLRTGKIFTTSPIICADIRSLLSNKLKKPFDGNFTKNRIYWFRVFCLNFMDFELDI